MESWKNYGLFQYQLLKGRDQLPGQIKARVRELTESSKDKIETIKILYRYLQQNTRYISIQLGIGGWQPFDAEYVARRGYGDCKALTNYMHSLLKEAGIPSYYALVNGGKDNYDRNRVKEDFPSVQFNHVILCVPSDADTTWLECTSQTLPAGYVSGFTSNRKALLIKEDGGYLVSTPRYGITDNLQLRKSKINIGENGDAKVYVETKYKGMEQDELLGLLNNISQDRVKRFLSSAISIPSYELNDYQYRPSASRIPELTETLSITARSLAAISGKRLFLTPNVFSKSSHLPNFDATRKIDFIFENSYYDSAEIEFIIPPGYSIESFIKPVSITTDFGRYTMSCTLLDNKIIYHRSLSQSESRIPLSRQEEITNFIREVYKADRAKLVLIKKD